MRAEIWNCIAALKAAGQSILVIDKNIDALSRIGDRHYIMEKGLIVWSGDSKRLKNDIDAQRRYLGL